jgi:hypothetical protein
MRIRIEKIIYVDEKSAQSGQHYILCFSYSQKIHPLSTGNPQKAVNHKGTSAPKRRSNFRNNGPIRPYTFTRASRYYSAP